MIVPQGFGTVAPYLFVNNAAAFGVFLEAAFGGEEVGRTTRPGNIIANLQIRIGSTTLMISEASDRYPAMPSAFYIYVEDAVSSMSQAIAAGATSELEVMDMDYGDRQGGVRDPFGNIWWVSQRLVETPYF